MCSEDNNTVKLETIYFESLAADVKNPDTSEEIKQDRIARMERKLNERSNKMETIKNIAQISGTILMATAAGIAAIVPLLNKKSDEEQIEQN